MKWLFCCGMKRSGSTLQYQIASRLATDHLNAKRVDWAPENEVDFAAEETGSNAILVYKCHRCVPDIAARLAHPENCGVYTFRDIRDVCGSWVRKHDSSFHRLIKTGFITECLENYRQFTAFENVLVTRYEDMVADLANEVRRIAAHLSIDLSQEEVSKLADEYSLDAQRKRIAKIAQGEGDTFQYGAQVIDRSELLHSNHITDGRIAAWAEFFNWRELAIIEEIAGDWMDAVGYARAADRLGAFKRWQLNRFRRTLPLS